MVKNKKLAVVLSGGGAKGAYEAGALVAIAKAQKRIDVITGASIGAINAALLAWEYEKSGDLLAATEKVRETWLSFDSLFKLSGWHLFKEMLVSLLKTGSPLNFDSFVDNKIIRAKLAELIPPKLKISDLKAMEVYINTTSLTSGKTVSFSASNDAYLYDAVLASSAIPLLFAAQNIAKSFYVDGGIFNNTPLRDAIMAQATDIYVVELKPLKTEDYFETIYDAREYQAVPRVGTRLLELILDKIMYDDLKNAKKINNIIDVIIALEETGGNAPLLAKLKESIGYEKNGHIKHRVNFCEIAPSERLDPPGTLGFDNKEALQKIMAMGEEDAKAALENLT